MGEPHKCDQEMKFDDVKQAVLDYAKENYPEEALRKARSEYPYSSAGLSDEQAFGDLMEWFILERVQPSTGKTIVREYAEKSRLSPEMKKRILQMEDVRFGEYEVLNVDEETERGRFHITLKDQNNQRYEVAVVGEHLAKCRKGWIAVGRLHPWENSHRLAGVMRLKPPKKRIEKMEKELANMKGILLEWIRSIPETDTDRRNSKEHELKKRRKLRTQVPQKQTDEKGRPAVDRSSHACLGVAESRQRRKQS